MLYKICIFQIVAYLLVSPLIRHGFGVGETNYHFDVGLLFLCLFIIGGLASSASKKNSQSTTHYLNIGLQGKILLIAWSLLYSILSVKYGLMDRRIGTHEAARVFSEIPVYDLVLFRVFELLFPVIISYLIAKKISLNWSSSDKLLILCLLLSLALSGVVFSRSQTFFILASTTIMLQNSLSRKAFRKLLFSGALLASLMFFLVSIYRLMSSSTSNFSEHFLSEILKRADGLELISQLIQIYGYPFSGINPSAVLSPIIASIPFLQAAVELKGAALTTVKSNVLDVEFATQLGDTNSFVILDVYYWGGFTGLMLSALFLGYVAKMVDKRIFLSKSILINSLLIAVASNVVYLEREFINILIGTIRDFIIYIVILFVIWKKPRNQLSKIKIG